MTTTLTNEQICSAFGLPAYDEWVQQHDAIVFDWAIDLVRVEKGIKIRDVTVDASDADHLARIVEHVRNTEGVEVERVSDRTFLMHLGGKIEMRGYLLAQPGQGAAVRSCELLVAEVELDLDQVGVDVVGRE